MVQELVMGNEAIALGALKAGVSVVTGYPGTPSTEILETIARRNPGDVYVEWSVNEKVALEVAAGAALAGARAMVTMKQVGLNVASDPVMSLAYIGVKGGMVIVVADDPGPISSQTEQDTRQFGVFSKLPVFDPTSPEEAYAMIGQAFQYSEKYQTPVLFRPTTRICHASVSLEISSERAKVAPEGFVKDPKWVIFPRLSYLNHIKIEKRNEVLAEDFATYKANEIIAAGDFCRKGIAAGGISYVYAKEALKLLGVSCKLFKVATPYPFPERLAREFLQQVDEVLVLEELSPFIEKELVYLCGKYQLPVKVKGKLTADMPCAGENTVENVKEALAKFFGLRIQTVGEGQAQHGEQAIRKQAEHTPPDIQLPDRPPVLCAGCPHRASFYAVKKAMKGRKAVFCGDIGCYTLGNAKPLEMVDTCLCMGADVTMAQGLFRVERDSVNFAFIGDSTFFHTGIPGVVNAVYNGAKIVLAVLDNSTTAMTGNQPHPGTGQTMMGSISAKIRIAKVLEALGVKHIALVNPFDLAVTEQAVREAADCDGVAAVIFEAPCIQLFKPAQLYRVHEEKCNGCRLCVKELGCPAMYMEKKKAVITPALCYGCSLCAQVCPFGAIEPLRTDGGENR